MPGPPRVLIVISSLGYGGAERQVVEFANSVDTNDIDLQLCSLSDTVPMAAELRRPSSLHIVRKRARFDPSVVWRLARLLRTERIDMVHGFLFDAEISAALAGRMAGTRIIVGSERNAFYELNVVQRLAYRLTRGCFDFVVANSSAGAKFNQELLGHAPGKYRVVRNGVDTMRFHPTTRAETRARLGLTDSDFAVGMFASFKKQKNHALLLQAAKIVQSQFPRLRLFLVGDALADNWADSRGYAASVQALTDSLGLRAVTSFLGARTDLPELYSACDLTVLPSRFEGTPNAVLESMACGCPVVVTDVADNAEIVPDGRVGLVVPLDDASAMAAAMLEIIRRPDWRAQLATNARRWAEEQFSLPVYSRRLTQVYREFLG